MIDVRCWNIRFCVIFPTYFIRIDYDTGSFFPILRSGKRKEIDWDRINRGIFLFVFGLGKKVLLADMFGQAVDWGYGNIASLNGMSMFLITVFYSFQIYFDFSGYSDMAIGISWMLNLDLPVNFDSPYKAYSVVEFWKKMAYFADQVFDKIYLYTVGRKQEREPENLLQHDDRFSVQRDLAWCKLDVCFMGSASWCGYGIDKGVETLWGSGSLGF